MYLFYKLHTHGTRVNGNPGEVRALGDARNFLYLINPDNTYGSKAGFIAALAATDYDLFIIDAFFDGVALDASAVGSLKFHGGRTRLVDAGTFDCVDS
ncbi:MAG: hypothetical protein GF418_00490 [Chitinivibrionales bacterium]|nr:hypothetical protein [Chitinivibrionales bacterium]MBD3394078.1 hypothetical protein [Chitinivibrionales bacterium]